MKSICFLIRFLLFSFLLNYTMTSTIRIWDHEKKHEAFFAHFECAPFSGIMRRGVHTLLSSFFSAFRDDPPLFILFSTYQNGTPRIRRRSFALTAVRAHSQYPCSCL